MSDMFKFIRDLGPGGGMDGFPRRFLDVDTFDDSDSSKDWETEEDSYDSDSSYDSDDDQESKKEGKNPKTPAEAKNQTRQSELDELERALAAKDKVCLDRDSELASAERLFSQKKYDQAYDLYFMLGKNPNFIFKDWKFKVPSEVFLQTRLILCLLGQKKFVDVGEFMEPLVAKASKDERVMEALATWLFSLREYKLSAIVAARGLQLYQGNQALEKLIRYCQKVLPNLVEIIEGESWSNFESAQELQNIFDQASSQEVSATPKLNPVQPSTKVDVWLERLALTIEQKKFSLAMNCLDTLSKDLSGEGNGMFYCYIRARILMAMKGQGNYEKAMTLLQELYNNSETPYLEVLYALSDLQILLQRYDDAEKTLAMVNLQKNPQLFGWPSCLEKCFTECNVHSLRKMLHDLSYVLASKRIVVATCRFDGCLHVIKDGIEPSRREIYASDGLDYYVVKCTEKCSVDFHHICWKRAKDLRMERSSCCFTPDCNGFLVEIVFVKGTKEMIVKDPILNAPRPEQPLSIKETNAPVSKSKPAKDTTLKETKKTKPAPSGNNVKIKATDETSEPMEGGVKDENTKTKKAVSMPIVKSTGAIPKNKTGQGRKQAFSAKQRMLDEVRNSYENDLKALGTTDSNRSMPIHNKQSLFFATIPKSMNSLFLIDDAVCSGDMAGVEARNAADSIRQSMREYDANVKMKRKEKKREEDEKQRLKHDLELEKELNFRLYQAMRKALQDIEQLEARVVAAEATAAEAAEAATAAAAAARATPIRDFTPPSLYATSHEVVQAIPDPPNIIQNEPDFALNVQEDEEEDEPSLEDLLKELNLPQHHLISKNQEASIVSFASVPSLDDPAIVHRGIVMPMPDVATTAAAAAPTPVAPTPIQDSGAPSADPELMSILMEAFPQKSRSETEVIIQQCQQEHGSNSPVDTGADDLDVQKTLLEMKKHGILPASVMSDTNFSTKQTTQYRQDRMSHFKSNNTECVICLEPLASGGDFVLQPCRHVFHNHCIREWLNENSVCPLCRKHIILDEDFPSLNRKGKFRR